jgi:hypothetical protein
MFRDGLLEGIPYNVCGFTDTVVHRDKYGNYLEKIDQSLQTFEGVNCQWIVAEYFYRLFGFDLNKSVNQLLFSQELTHNQEIFEDTNLEDLAVGDIFIFSSGRSAINNQGQDEATSDRWNHLGIFTGKYDENNSPIILHGNFAVRKSARESLSKIQSYKRKNDDNRWNLIKIRRFKLNPFSNQTVSKNINQKQCVEN